jgi:hypothetical protein
MKTVLTKYLALCSLTLLMLPACKKNEALVTSNGGKAGTLNTTTTTPVLDKSKLNDTTSVVNFSFTAPNYGYSAAVTNTLQIDAAGDNWKNPASATLGTKVYSQGYSTAVFNNLVLKLNLPAGTASQVMVRVMHTISTSVAPIYSNVLTLTVTPFNLTSWVYVVGAFDGWPQLPAKGTDSLISVTGNGIYTGIINFPAGANQFLILPQSNNYNNKYATTQSSGTTSTVTVGANNNLTAPATAGQYIITLDLNTNTISFVPADYYSIIGSATPGGDWSTDMFLKFVNDGNNNWVGTFSLLAGQFKFRQDASWSNAWGTLATPDGVTVTDANGGNINATAGTHTVTFNMLATPFGTSTYTNLPTYNNVPFPFVTTTYTLQ